MPSHMEEYSTAVDQIKIMEENNAILLEQLKSLNLENQYKDYQLKLTENELEYTNQELCDALSLQKIEFAQAKEMARLLLESDNYTTETLVVLLNNIYGDLLKPEELEPMKKQENKNPYREKSLKGDKDNIRVANFKEIIQKTQEIKERYKDNGIKYVSFKARFLRQVEEFRAKKEEWVSKFS